MESGIAPEASAIETAVISPHGVTADSTSPAESFVAHYLDGVPYAEITEYCRYWHGYLIVIKPLLYLMNYNTIRVLNGIAQLLIVLTICWLIHKKKLTAYIPAVILSYLMMMPHVLARSIQFSTCFYVIVLALLGLLLIPNEKLNRFGPYLFLAAGMATSYFDFLTYPIATFGIPMLMLLLLQRSEKLEKKLVNIAKCGLFWCIGFGGLWVCKWALCYIVCGYNLSQIFSIVAERTSMSEVPSVLYVEFKNFAEFFKTLATFFVLAFVTGRNFFKKRSASALESAQYRAIFPYLLVSSAPFVWFAFAANHSNNHYWFTNKALWTTMVGLLITVITLRVQSKDSNSHTLDA